MSVTELPAATSLGTLVTELPAKMSTSTSQRIYHPVATYSQMPVMLLQLLSQLHALDLAYAAVQQKCEAAAEKVEEERKRRSRDRVRCDEREEKLMSELLAQKKLVFAASKDKEWVEELMNELQKRYNESQEKWQEELDICKKNGMNTMEQLEKLQVEEQNIMKQLKDCNNRLQGISRCPSEKQALLEDKNAMAEALRLFDGSVKNQMLLRAAHNGNAVAVKGLVNTGADIHVKDNPDNYRRTPLHWGATEGHVEVMKTLINLGADPRYDVDSDIYNLLHSAARYGRPNAVRYLLDGKWLSVNAIVPGRKETALHLASRYGHTEVIDILLAAGANIDARNFRGSTPLHMAAWNGRKTAVFTLVNNGASLTLSDNDGNAYQNALSEGHYDIAQFIKSKMQ